MSFWVNRGENESVSEDLDMTEFLGNKTRRVQVYAGALGVPKFDTLEVYTDEYVHWLEARLELARKRIKDLNHQNEHHRARLQRQHRDQSDYLDYEEDDRG